MRWLAIVGRSSMGAHVEWAAAYPAMIDRDMTVIGAEIDPRMIAWLDVWEASIRLDAAWQNVEYCDGEQPVRGLADGRDVREAARAGEHRRSGRVARNLNGVVGMTAHAARVAASLTD